MWYFTSYSRRRGKIVAFVVGNTLDCPKELYNKTKRVVGNIARIYTDGNSIYKRAFSDLGVSDLYFVAAGKSLAIPVKYS